MAKACFCLNLPTAGNIIGILHLAAMAIAAFVIISVGFSGEEKLSKEDKAWGKHNFVEIRLFYWVSIYELKNYTYLYINTVYVLSAVNVGITIVVLSFAIHITVASLLLVGISKVSTKRLYIQIYILCMNFNNSRLYLPYISPVETSWFCADLSDLPNFVWSQMLDHDCTIFE